MSLIFTQILRVSSLSTLCSSPQSSPTKRPALHLRSTLSELLLTPPHVFKRARHSSQHTLASFTTRPTFYVSLEIVDRILRYLDEDALRVCIKVGSPRVSKLARRYLANNIREVSIDYNDDRFGEPSQSQLLLRLTNDVSFGGRVHSISIYDGANEDRPCVPATRFGDVIEPEIMGRVLQEAEERFLIAKGYFHHDEALVEILRRLDRLGSFSFLAPWYELDWDRYQRQHNLAGIFEQPTLTSIRLRGVVNLPIHELEKATNLSRLSLSNYGFLWSQSDPTAPTESSIMLDVLQFKNIKSDAREMQAYIESPRSILSVSTLTVFETDVVHRGDAQVAAAVVRMAPGIEIFKMSTRSHHYGMNCPSDLALDKIDLSRLTKLSYLYVRLDFTNGVEAEMSWFLDVLLTFPVSNSLEHLLIKIDLGPSSNDEDPSVKMCKNARLRGYSRWNEWESVLYHPKFKTLGQLDIVISSDDDFDKYSRPDNWSIDDCVPVVSALRGKSGLKLRVHDVPEYTVRYMAPEGSFTYAEP